MRSLRLILFAVAGLVVGTALTIRAFWPLPELESLDRVSGVVQFGIGTHKVDRQRTVEYPVLIIEGSRYEYPQWFPNAAEISRLVRGDENVTIWTDADQNAWVWQIEQDGQIVIPYSDVRKAVESNRQSDWLLGGGFFALSAVAALILLSQFLAKSR